MAGADTSISIYSNNGSTLLHEDTTVKTADSLFWSNGFLYIKKNIQNTIKIIYSTTENGYLGLSTTANASTPGTGLSNLDNSTLTLSGAGNVFYVVGDGSERSPLISLSNLQRFKILDDGIYQARLVSGTNIKTINNTSLLGSGNITISGEPSAYIKSASTSGNTLTLTKKDDTTVTYTPTFTDTNYYPTSLSWTNGTTAGPIGKLSGTGMSTVNFPAIPSATTSQSGIVTTAGQSFKGYKTFTEGLSTYNYSDTPVSIGFNADESSIMYLFDNSTGCEIYLGNTPVNEDLHIDLPGKSGTLSLEIDIVDLTSL